MGGFIKEGSYVMVYGEEGVGSRGSFGLKIFVADSERPPARGGMASVFDTKEDREIFYDIARQLKAGVRGNTQRMQPDFADKLAKAKEYYRGLFTEAGVAPIYMQALPNGYCPEPGGWCCLTEPWFRVTTPFGHVKIGWRKSVMDIDWTESDVTGTGEDLFPDETTTKGGDGDNRFIHAHGDKKAIQYLRTLSKAV